MPTKATTSAPWLTQTCSLPNRAAFSTCRMRKAYDISTHATEMMKPPTSSLGG